MLLKLCESNQQLMLEKYLDRACYYFTYIPNLPRILYVKGCPADKRFDVERKSRDNWNDICNFHFLVFSYALSKGMNGLLEVLTIEKIYWNYNLMPKSAPDILLRYARCKNKLNGEGGYDLWRPEDNYGKRVNIDEIISQFTMMLLLLSSDKENRQTVRANLDDLKILKDQRDYLLVKARQLQADTKWQAADDSIKNINVGKIYDDTLESIRKSLERTDEDGNVNGKTSASTILLEIINALIHFKCPHNRKQKEKNWYEEPITPEQKQQFEREFNRVEESIELFVPRVYLNVDGLIKPGRIDINECALVVDKQYFMLSDNDMLRDLYEEYMECITSRVVYAMLKAYQQMNIEDISIIPADFGHYIDGYIQSKPEDYLIVDVDSHLSSWIHIDLGVQFRRSYKGIPFLTIESVGRFNYLVDLPAYDYFRDSLLLVRRNHQPSLRDKDENGTMVFNYNDESSEEKRTLALRIGVDINKVLTFNPTDTIIRIRTKKMIV